MSDEAFARRFYSDRAELIALGVPLHSQRDEFTGEELYTLRSEQYFLPELELDDDELAALQTALFLLDGKFAYAEPLRLALQNLALGRPGFSEQPTRDRRARRGPRPRLLRRDARPAGEARGRDLEAADDQVPVLLDLARQRVASGRSTRYALLTDNGIWYVVGEDLDDKRRKKFRVSRIRGDIRFATRRERDFRTPTDFDIDEYRGRPPWQIGDIAGEARIEVTERHRLVGRARLRPDRAARGRRLRHRVLVASRCSPRGCCARTAARCRSSRPSCGARSRARSAPCSEAHRGEPPALARGRAAHATSDDGAERTGRAGDAGALRRAPGAARVPARALRRGPRGDDPGRRARRALPHPARGARGSPLAAQPRQLRRRLLHGLRRARATARCTSTRSCTARRSARRRG